MANLFSLYVTLLLLSTSIGALMVMVASDRCKEEVGPCSDGCKTWCINAHLGDNADGLCEPGENYQQGCWCYYDCPPKKTCQDGFPAQDQCDVPSCDAQCTSRHPGQGAQGYCDYESAIPALYVCRCTYFC